MPTIKDHAVCIRQWDWSETSQTISLFTRNHGVIRAVAKGSKREKTPFSGGLELLTHGEMVALVRQNERSPDALSTLTSWDLIETFPAIRKSLSAFYTGLYFADLVHHAIRDSDPHAALFDRLILCLERLDGTLNNQAALLCFQWSTLVQTGFAPELARDAVSGVPLPALASVGFSPGMGGLTSLENTANDGTRARDTVWRVRPETVETLRRAAAADTEPDPVTSLFPSLTPDSVLRANRLLAWYFRSILGTWPKSANAAIPGVTEVEP